MTKNLNRTNPKSSHPATRYKESPGAPTFLTRRRALFTLGAVVAIGGGALFLGPTPTMAEEVVVYKDPSCECCGRWVRHMRENGFAVTVNSVEDMDTIKRTAGVPEAVDSCHTAFIGDYLVEGHVPASDIKRMLAGHSTIEGLAVPGMPISAPGMDSSEYEPFSVLAFNAMGETRVFASY